MLPLTTSYAIREFSVDPNSENFSYILSFLVDYPNSQIIEEIFNNIAIFAETRDFSYLSIVYRICQEQIRSKLNLINEID